MVVVWYCVEGRRSGGAVWMIQRSRRSCVGEEKGGERGRRGKRGRKGERERKGEEGREGEEGRRGRGGRERGRREEGRGGGGERGRRGREKIERKKRKPQVLRRVNGQLLVLKSNYQKIERRRVNKTRIYLVNKTTNDVTRSCMERWAEEKERKQLNSRISG